MNIALISPVAFKLGKIEVRWYGLLIALAIAIGIYISLKRSKNRNYTEDDVLDFFLYLIPAMIIGARLYYVIFEWHYYAQQPSRIFALWEGGLAIHGGLLAGILVCFWYCHKKKISFLHFADGIIPAVPLGQAIGRWGNFINQEAYGRETDLPWAIEVWDANNGLIKVHPTFFYESICNILTVIILLVYEKHYLKRDGELLFLYFICYSSYRFFIEALRTDSLMLGSLRVAQIISVILAFSGLIGLLVIRRNAKSTY